MPHPHPFHSVERRGEFFTLRIKNANTPWLAATHLGELFHFARGHWEPGVRGNGLFLILKGSIRITYSSDLGKQRALLIVGENSLFNELPCITGDYPDVSFYCPEKTAGCRFPASLLTDPDFVAAHPQLIINLMQSMAEKSSLFFKAACDKTFDSTTKQLCRLLLKMREDGGFFCEYSGLSQTEMASILGVHPTTLARSVRRLREAGLIGRLTRNSLELLDIQGLERWSAGEN